jgi:hypothetical protein
MTLKSKFFLWAMPLFFLLLAVPAWTQDAPDAAAEPAKIPPIPAGAKLDMRAAVQRGLDANPAIVAARHALLGSESGRKSALADFSLRPAPVTAGPMTTAYPGRPASASATRIPGPTSST